MAGLFGIGGSGNTTDRNTELGAWGNLNNIGGWAKKFGKGQAAAGADSLGTASNFFKTLLSGNQAEIGTVLAPEIGTINNQADQNRKTIATFGNRSGGNNAEINHSTDTASAAIQNMISTLLAGSGQELGQLGATQEGLGLSAEQLAANAFATVGGQSMEDRIKWAGPLQQAQQSEVMAGLKWLSGKAGLKI